MIQTVLRPVGVKVFVVLPKRWIVERKVAWLGRYRRHSKDYERTRPSVFRNEFIEISRTVSLPLKFPNLWR